MGRRKVRRYRYRSLGAPEKSPRAAKKKEVVEIVTAPASAIAPVVVQGPRRRRRRKADVPRFGRFIAQLGAVERAGSVARLRAATMPQLSYGYAAAGAVAGHLVRARMIDPWLNTQSESMATAGKWAWIAAAGVAAWRTRKRSYRSIAVGVFAEAAAAALLDAAKPTWWVNYTNARRDAFSARSGGGGGTQNISNRQQLQLPPPQNRQQSAGQSGGRRQPARARNRSTIAGYDASLDDVYEY